MSASASMNFGTAGATAPAMAGNKRQQKKSSFSFFSLFKSRKPRREEIEDSYFSARKVWPSEEDRGGIWVADPAIDGRAAAFINRIHRNIVSEADCQTLTVNPAAEKA